MSGSVFPIKLMEGRDGFGFCPAKLFRDDPVFVSVIRHLWLCWKMGQVPSDATLDTIDEEDADLLTFLIQAWERYSEDEKFKRLAMMFGGDKND